MSHYNIGDTIRVKATFKDADDALSDPSTVTVTVYEPDGTETDYTLTGGGVQKESTGVYYADITPTQAGIHWYRFSSTGNPALIEEANFFVVPDSF